MGLFSTKKKEDTSSSNSQQTSQQASQPGPKQRPPPSPNGLGGPNNSNNGMQGGIPTNGNSVQNGHNNSSSFGPGGGGVGSGAPLGSNGPMSPMSPTFSQHSGSVIQQLQGPFSPLYGPTSPIHSQSTTFPPQGSTPGGPLAAPQLFWTQRRILGTNPFPRFQHTSSVTVNGTDIYLYGGSQRGATKDDLFLIDSVSLQCQAVAAAGSDPPMAKSGHSAVNIGQYIIYFGGWDSMTGRCDDSLHVLHTARKEWNKPSIQGTLPTPRHSHTGSSVGTTMYIFGGQVDNFYLDDIVAFDMKSITQNPRWDKLEPQTESPPARSGHCAGVHEGKIYIFGGADADYFYNDIWCFDPRALTWTPIPASGYLPTGRHGHACTVADGTMYIFGGNSPDGTELNDAYAFKIHERRWYLFQNVGPVASVRSGHTMCTIKDRIFVLGGASEQTKLEDSALIYYLEISKIRYPDTAPSTIPPRQASSQQAPDQLQAVGYESERNPGQQRAAEKPERPDRRYTQRPASPASFGPMDRQGSAPNLSIAQQTSQLMNPQLGQRPLTTFGAPPPRGASSGFQNPGPMNDYQAEGLSVATRRQTLRDDFQGGYGGAVVGTAGPTSPNVNRRTMHQMPTSPPGVGGPSPLRVVNASPTSPPLSSRPLPGGGDNSPTATRPDRRTMNFVPAPASGSNNVMEDINPYAMEAITPSAAGSQSSYVPPPMVPVSVASAAPSISTSGANFPLNTSQPSPSTMRANLPPPPSTSSPPVSGAIPLPPGADKKAVQGPPPPPHSIGASTPIPGPLDRSSSPGGSRLAARGSGGSGFSLGPAPSSPIPSTDSAVRTSVQDMAKIKSLESKAGAVQDENELLKQEIKEQQAEVEKMKKRENWLMAEVILARDSLSSGKMDSSKDSMSFQNKRLSMIDLERELEGSELEGQQLKITKVLIKVKEELRTAKMSIATQAQAASFKIKEAERVRTGALQEAAYLKAKLLSMTNAQQDPGALARVEMDRAADLEKRLTSALNDLETLEVQYAQAQENLEQERISRISAEERSQGSTSLADQAQSAHTRALAELTSLHSRAAKAEAESREFATQLAETQAGFSGHQSQSSGLLQKIKSLKQQVEDHEKALERTQMAYSAANERATRAEARSDEDSVKIEKLESQRFELSSDINRYKGEAERLQSKVDELETRCQVSKDEVITLRKLVEDGLGAFSPRGKAEKSLERKHDSIAILSTVSKMSELEHELGSLKKLHNLSQASASKSAAELAEAMIEVSRLEQASMQARAETISLQKMLSQDREGSAQLKSELSRTEMELEIKIKELEDHEVQLGLLKDVMREKGIIAEDIIMQARTRGTAGYAVSMEEKVREAEERTRMLEQDLEETRDHYTQQLGAIETQRQATIQHSEKTALLLRKIKNDLEATMKEKSAVEAGLKQLREEHAVCGDHAVSRDNQKEQEAERLLALKMQWDEERRELSGQVSSSQNRLMESEMHAAELSQKVIAITERLQEVEGLNEVIADELESLQDQHEEIKGKATKQETQLKADVERLVSEIHQVQEKLHAKQIELDETIELNEQLESQLDHALQAQAAAATASASNPSQSTEALQQLEEQRQELEQRLKKAQETIQILEGDNSVLEARLSDSEKKVTLLLDNMHSGMTDASNPNSATNSANLAGVHQQLTNLLNSKSDSASNPVSPSNLNQNSHQGSSATTAHRLLNNVRNVSNSGESSSPARVMTSPPSSNASHTNKSAVNHSSYMQQALHTDDYSDDEYQYDQGSNHHYQQNQHSYDDGHDINYTAEDHAADRDSVDSITRELEMLKVPWNKNPVTSAYKNPSSNNSNAPLPPSQQSISGFPAPPNSQAQQPYQYSGAPHGHQNQFYDYSDSSEGDNEVEYLSHVHQQQQQQQQQQHTMDTHSFNDRSPSRLKEYEQMIDEIENARMH
ncbi:Negative regulator of mitotic exit [Dissophora ornata]|nr:Negative regulator of mitotic exit [Dissophora ornata]